MSPVSFNVETISHRVVLFALLLINISASNGYFLTRLPPSSFPTLLPPPPLRARIPDITGRPPFFSPFSFFAVVVVCRLQVMKVPGIYPYNRAIYAQASTCLHSHAKTEENNTMPLDPPPPLPTRAQKTPTIFLYLRYVLRAPLRCGS